MSSKTGFPDSYSQAGLTALLGGTCCMSLSVTIVGLLSVLAPLPLFPRAKCMDLGTEKAWI